MNNVLCFPFIFRGALDVGATEINDAMQIACVEGIAALARASSSAEAAAAYQGERLSFGRDYLIPKAFDPRLLAIVASAVAEAAMKTGVATRPVADFDAYRAELNRSVYRSAFIMRTVFDTARSRQPAHRLRRGRGRTGAACGERDERGGDRAADPDRAAGGDRGALRAERHPAAGRARLRARQPRGRPALPRLLGHLPFDHAAAGGHARPGAGDHAHQQHGDRGGDGAPRRGRQPDLRHLRAVPLAPQVYPGGAGRRLGEAASGGRAVA